MNNLISQCNDLMKDCGFSYAICGGYALELFLNKKIRSHSDVDLSIFEEDRAAIVKFLISKGWNLYERLNGSLTGQLRLITDSETVSPLFCIWAIKSDCSFFKIEPETNTENIYNYEIISNEQIYLDFIEILFNKREEDNFVFDSSSSQGKHITRKLSKAILYTTKSIPYLAPEVKLLMIANPVYMDSDYHGTKNQTDFEAVAPKLLKESRDWLINALETAYPDGHKRIEGLKNLEVFG